MSDRPKTIRDVYGPAMAVTDQDEADRVFARLVVLHLAERPGDTVAEAARVQRVNLAYYAGYYDRQTRERVERLYRCAHPYLGPVADSPTDPGDIMAAGAARAAGIRTAREKRAAEINGGGS